MQPNRRLLKELHRLTQQQNERPLLSNEYLVYFDESNVFKVHTIIAAPHDSVYRHRFVRLDFDIPEDYPHSPPNVTFVNYDGVRIHPNMYESGKCCSTILNTWGNDVYEKWTSSMGIETVLLTFRSFLDNHPYTFEPGGQDEPSYTVYVLHETWQACLFRYLQYERIHLFQEFIRTYMMWNIDEIVTYVQDMSQTYSAGTYYCRCFEIDYYTIDYERILGRLQHVYMYLDGHDVVNDADELASIGDASKNDCRCHICYDTSEHTVYLTLQCGHTFHKKCMRCHIAANGALCSMCRTDVARDDMEHLDDESVGWIINPQTKRRVNVGTKRYLELIDEGVI